MRNVLTILKKEWDRVIKDRRLVFSVMLLPGLMIFALYSFIGGAIGSMYSDLDERIAIVNAPTSFVDTVSAALEDSEWEYTAITDQSIFEYSQKIDDAEWELMLVFPNGFETSVSAEEKPEIQIYYNPNEIASEQLYSQYYQLLTVYEQQLAFLVYGDTVAFQVATDSMPFDETQATGTMVAMLLPMLVLMFLFSGAMAIGPEAIAGEKERGTIATLLITPVKRSEIALGKVLGLSILSLLSALSSFLGIIFSLPKMFAGQDIDMSIYTVGDYAQILFVLFSTVFVIVGIISIVSAYAKSMKEAGTMIMPFYLLTIIIGISSMFGQEATTNPLMYMIPLYNSVQTLIAVFTFDELSWLYMLITVVTNIICLGVFIYVLNKMFRSEKIMFSK